METEYRHRGCNCPHICRGVDADALAGCCLLGRRCLLPAPACGSGLRLRSSLPAIPVTVVLSQALRQRLRELARLIRRSLVLIVFCCACLRLLQVAA